MLLATTTSSGSQGIVVLVFFLAIGIASLAGWWKIFTKAEEPGWGAIIPIYNIYLMCKVAKRPAWWTVLFFIPLVNIAISAIVMIDIARAFRRTVGFGIGLWLLSFVFAPMLGFGADEYEFDEYEEDDEDYGSQDWEPEVAQEAPQSQGFNDMMPATVGFASEQQPAQVPAQAYAPAPAAPMAPTPPPAPAVTNLPPAGWFEDPQNPTQFRYWDGATWTNHFHPKQG